MSREVNVLALLKGRERYIFVYDDESHDLLLETIRDQAADPKLSLTWFDATVLVKRSYEQMVEAVFDAPTD